jgi:AraC-like DNA-binding protein
MVTSGTATFTNPDDYRIGIDGADVLLTVTSGGDFEARLTWLNLRQLRVVRGWENLPRIAYISLPPNQVVFSFATSAAPIIWNGLELRFGEVLFRGRGERTHQWTTRDSKWGLISLPPEQLAACGRALTGAEVPLSPGVRMLRPSRTAAAHLLRLHSKICRLAETRQQLLFRREVVRSMEQELVYALVHCLKAKDVSGNLKTKLHRADIMARFEDALTAHPRPRLNMPELCATVGVPERTLRMCCSEFLGMSPTRYHLLRRLNEARSALRRSDPATASVAEIARSCQFSEPGRFAVAYRELFGEMPSTTLRMKEVQSA